MQANPRCPTGASLQEIATSPGVETSRWGFSMVKIFSPATVFLTFKEISFAEP
jgi:hypothetical protein